MAMRKILVDETNRELCEHGTAGFPMTTSGLLRGKVFLFTGIMTWRSAFPEREKQFIRFTRKAILSDRGTLLF